MTEQTEAQKAAARAPGLLQKLQSTIDAEPTGSVVLARVLRIEKILENMGRAAIHELYEDTIAPAVKPPEQPQQQQQKQPQQPANPA